MIQRRHKVRLILLCLSIIFSSLVIVIIWKKFNSNNYITLDRQTDSWPYKPKACIVRGMRNICKNTEYTHAFNYIGDSHAQQLMFSQDVESDLNFKHRLISSEIMLFDWINVEPSEDLHLRDAQSFIEGLTKKDTLIISFTTGHLKYKTNAELSEKISKMKKLIEFLLNNISKDVKIFGILDNPVLDVDIAHLCSLFENHRKSFCQLQKSKYQKKNKNLKEILQNISKGDRLVKIIDPTEFFCGEIYCKLYIDNKFILLDDNHLRAEVVHFYYKKFIEEELKNNVSY